MPTRKQRWKIVFSIADEYCHSQEQAEAFATAVMDALYGVPRLLRPARPVVPPPATKRSDGQARKPGKQRKGPRPGANVPPRQKLIRQSVNPIKEAPAGYVCSGEHDDGIADGNPTNCSRRSGCGGIGCPYVR